MAQVNGHSLYYSCGGTGQSVLFLAGLGGDHTLWPIADRLRSRANACTYDRYGDGSSSELRAPTTVVDDAADLHVLLDELNVAQPVILVGHSYGGLLAYYAARTYPEDVAGLVLIDPSHPQQAEAFDAVLNDEQRVAFAQPSPGLSVVDFDASVAIAANQYGSLGNLPLTVLDATDSFRDADCEALPCPAMQVVATELHQDYAALSTNAQYLPVDASHYIHEDQPDLVVTQILALLDRVPIPAATAAGP